MAGTARFPPMTFVIRIFACRTGANGQASSTRATSTSRSSLLYPTRFMHIGQIGNPRYAVELCRAYNDFLAEQFLTQDRRFRGMALLPLQDVSAAVKELRRAVKNHGMVGGILPAEGL